MKFFIIPCLLTVLYLSLQLIVKQTQNDLTLLAIRPTTFSFSPAPYPIVKSVLAAKSNALQKSQVYVSAKAYAIMDDESKVVIAVKNEKTRFPMASTAKIMTAIIGLEQFSLDSVLTVRSSSISGSIVGLVPGDDFYFRDLLYAMLLPSGNDAALTIADNYPGGQDAFIAAMNKKAAELSLSATHFADPSGIGEDNTTTVIDLAWLASLAIKNDVIADIVKTKRATITNVSKSKIYPLNNLNKLLGTDGVNGIKTGFTDEAGGVLTTSQKVENHSFIIVVMGSKERFADTQELLQSITKNVTFQNVALPFIQSSRFSQPRHKP